MSQSNFKRHIVRPAVIMDVNYGAQTCLIQYADRADRKLYSCPIPHPFASAGWGILVCPTKGTRVLVDTTIGERPVITATIGMNQFAGDFSNLDLLNNVSVDNSSYPILKPGEMALQSPSGSKMGFGIDGSIKFDIHNLKLEYGSSGVASTKYTACYENTEAHRAIAGPVLRDRRSTPQSVESIQDRLIPLSADKLWSPVGRNPTIATAPLTIQSQNRDQTIRNPQLVEHRSLVYEFARTHMTGEYADEKKRTAGGETSAEAGKFLFQPDRRDMLRTDVFNLGPHLPNNLIERIDGTAVDIYGNVLDINRNIIDFSGVDLKDELRIEHESALLRRSIKYHFEINSRKSTLTEGNSDVLDGHNDFDEATNTGHSFSRLSVDIDGEGLTKINIPASSNTGNIPLLTRHQNLHDPNNRNSGKFRPTIDENHPTRRDVQHIPFGHLSGTGIDIPQNYAPPNITEGGKVIDYHTAHHEISQTAAKVLQAATLTTAVATSLDNTIIFSGVGNPNAGGRSIHANLDGSLELNIGRDTADKKSVVIDTSGSIVSRIGKDNNQNSIVSQTDGNVLVQVGGDSVVGDDVAQSNSVRFYVNNGSGNAFHKIEITSAGVFITSAPGTNLVLQSENNLILAAKGRTLIGGETINIYGTYSDNGNTISGEQLLVRHGHAVV